ncbi:hypothetical protein WJX81_005405 [Elliptochloris bilobata]|uniref:SRR1-like domain-containing protein n=1 Tax=Elliptochloris bilobata TaxID=381761 RepID=A0AAW1RV47_9CHLO
MLDIRAAADEWKVVRRRGRATRTSTPVTIAGCEGDEGSTAAAQPAAAVARAAGRRGQERTLAERISFLCGKVREAQAEVRDSAFYSCGPGAAAWRWEAAEALVVFGLGSLEGGPVPRYQLALALLLAARLPALRRPIEAYDPVFTELDRAVLADLEVQMLDADEQGRRVAAVPTLFYLPHCEVELCDGLLAANAASHTLGRVAVLGNSFRLYAERWALCGGSAQHAHRRARPEWGRPRVVEVDIAAEFRAVPAAFNDMGVHLFPRWDPVMRTVAPAG